MLQIEVLGGVTAHRDGQQVRLSRQQRTLLAHLVVEPGLPVSADLLVDALGLGKGKDPRHALEAHVSRLRQRLGVELRSTGGGYLLVADAVWTDVHEFLAAVDAADHLATQGLVAGAEEQWRRALEIWRHQPYRGLDDHDRIAQEAAWLDSVHERTEARWIDARLLLGEAPTTVDRLMVLVAAHPLRERHWGQLLAALHACGRQPEAVDCFDRARRTIDDALGVRPGRQLMAIHQAILQGASPDDVVQLAVDLPQASTAAPAPSAGPPAARMPADAAHEVVRQQELTRLLEYAAMVPVGGRSVVVTGAPGLGKTRLLEGFVEGARNIGMEVHQAQCSPLAPAAFGPIREVLRRDLDSRPEGRRAPRLGPHAAHLVPLVADLVPGEVLVRSTAERPGDDLGSGRVLLFDAVVAWLRERARSATVCLVIDDLHWADPETLHLLDAVRAAEVSGLVVVLAQRDASAESVPESGPAGPTTWAADDRTLRIDLQRLPAEQAEVVVRFELQQLDEDLEVSPAAVATMVELGGGHPLHLVELARHWFTHRSADFPDSLVGAVSQRLHRIDPEVRSVLVDAALLGGMWATDLLAAVSEVAADEVVRAVARAADARLVEPVPGRAGWYRFTHELVRTALLHGVDADSVRARRGRIADVLEGRRTADSETGLAELGRQYAASLSGAVNPHAADYLAQAGDQAMKQHAPFVALGFYQEGLALLDGAAPDELAVDLHHGLGLAQSRTGNPAGRKSLFAAAALAEELGDLDRMTAAVVANNRGWYSDLSGCDEQQLQMVERALALSPPEGESPRQLRSRALLLAAWAIEAVLDPVRRTEALEQSATALEIGERLGDPQLTARLVANHYSVCHTAFRPAACFELADRLLGLAHELDDPTWKLYALLERVQTRFQTGDLAAVDAALPEAMALAVRLRAPAQRWMLSSWQAMSHLLHGDLVEAECQVGVALELGLAANQPDAGDWFLGQVFLIRWMGGRLDEIIAEVEDQADDLAERIPVWRAGLAMARAETGDLVGARRLVDVGLAVGFALPRDMLWLPGMCFWARAATLTGHVAAADHLRRQLLPYEALVAHNGTVDAGPVAAHLADLAVALGDTAGAERHAAHALRWSHSADARLWTEHVAARLHRPARGAQVAERTGVRAPDPEHREPVDRFVH